jgi:hypothetical protein
MSVRDDAGTPDRRRPNPETNYGKTRTQEACHFPYVADKSENPTRETGLKEKCNE